MLQCFIMFPLAFPMFSYVVLRFTLRFPLAFPMFCLLLSNMSACGPRPRRREEDERKKPRGRRARAAMQRGALPPVPTTPRRGTRPKRAGRGGRSPCRRGGGLAPAYLALASRRAGAATYSRSGGLARSAPSTRRWQAAGGLKQLRRQPEEFPA